MKKNKTLILVVGILLVIVVGVSFAYFLVTTNITGEGSNVNLGTSDLPKVIYDAGSSKLEADNLFPGDKVSKSFKVTASSKKEAEITYAIYIDITNNTFQACTEWNYDKFENDCEIGAEELIYRLKDTNGNIIAEGDLTERYGGIQIKNETKTINGNTEYNYTLEIEFKDTNRDQNHNANAIFEGSIEVEFVEKPKSKVLARDFLKRNAKRDEFESITTVSNTNIPDNAIKSWDAGELEDGQVMAWYTDTNNNGLYELYLGQDGGVVAPEDSWNLFGYNDTYTISFSKVTAMDLNNLDTSNVTNMNSMFAETGSLISLDLSNFNTSNVEYMNAMFSGASSLASLDLSNFNTSNVTDMSMMFSGASSLTTLDLSNFNTSNVTNMNSMFAGASSLTSLDLRKADFSNNSDHGNMFWEDSKLNDIIVKDTTAQDFINARLTDDNITGVNVTIAS